MIKRIIKSLTCFALLLTALVLAPVQTGAAGNNDALFYNLDYNEDAPNVNKTRNQMISNAQDALYAKGRAIIGTDDRTLMKTPMQGIVLITYKLRGMDGVFNATGFYIGDKKIVTAAHATIFESKKIEWASVYYPFKFYDMSENKEKIDVGHTNVDKVYLPRAYAERQASEYDYAVMVVEDIPTVYPIVSNGAAQFHKELPNMIPVNTSSMSLIGVTASVTGFPNIHVKQPVQHTMTGWTTANGNYLFYEVDTQAGQSGAPVYTDQDRNVYAIHVGTETTATAGLLNRGLLIRQEVYDFIEGPIPSAPQNEF